MRGTVKFYGPLLAFAAVVAALVYFAAAPAPRPAADAMPGRVLPPRPLPEGERDQVPANAELDSVLDQNERAERIQHEDDLRRLGKSRFRSR